MVKKDLLTALCWLTIGRIDQENKSIDESYRKVIEELEYVLEEVEEYDRKKFKLTILPWDED